MQSPGTRERARVELDAANGRSSGRHRQVLHGYQPVSPLRVGQVHQQFRRQRIGNGVNPHFLRQVNAHTRDAGRHLHVTVGKGCINVVVLGGRLSQARSKFPRLSGSCGVAGRSLQYRGSAQPLTGQNCTQYQGHFPSKHSLLRFLHTKNRLFQGSGTGRR